MSKQAVFWTSDKFNYPEETTIISLMETAPSEVKAYLLWCTQFISNRGALNTWGEVKNFPPAYIVPQEDEQLFIKQNINIEHDILLNLITVPWLSECLDMKKAKSKYLENMSLCDICDADHIVADSKNYLVFLNEF